MPSRATSGDEAKILRGLRACILGAAFAATMECPQATAQWQDPGAFQPPADASMSSQNEAASPGLGNGSLPISLSAAQVIGILQEDPDLAVELKSVLADRLGAQGLEIDPADISDQFLYNQVVSNASLRGSIATLLQARGYGVSTDFGLSVPGASVAPDAMDSQQAQALENGTADPAALRLLASGGSAAEPSSALALAARSAQPDWVAEGAARDLRRVQAANASTDAPQVLRQPAPYDLQSMRDLYTQIPNGPTGLTRFGSEVFLNRSPYAPARTISSGTASLDAPLGPDYVLGAGDSLSISLWGSVTQSITRTIGRDGRILLPEAGSMDVAGLALGQAESSIEGALKPQFHDVHVSVTVTRLRTVRVYVVGDVRQPGGYDISSLSTPLSALYAAGGPTSVGSLRTLRHIRGKTLIEVVDLYDFLLHGMHARSAPFESGDTLLVPPSGALVAIDGAVKRPAVYELKSDKASLAEVVADAGGFTAAASFSHIRIERIDANRERETLSLPAANAPSDPDDGEAVADFLVRDGDRIKVAPILPYSQRSVYLAGHVVRPGRLPYADGMRLSDILRSDRDLLPEPASRGEIVRLVPPDLHAETLDFNVPDILGGNANFELQPFDTIRVFGRYEIDAPTVTIAGEVMRPGKYPMSRGMTAAQLVRMAGGFKRDALEESADLTSYEVDHGNQVVEQVSTVRIGAAVNDGDPQADVPLKPGDTLSIHQISNWNAIGESVTINGEVRYPGSYGFKDGERLSSVLRRAGGMLPGAYPMGAILVREQVRDLEESSRAELVKQIETNSSAARLSPGASGSNGAATLQLIQEQQDKVLAELKSHPPSGRLVIHISADIDSWANTFADIELRRGDVLTIPKRPGFVLVTGQVYNAAALTFVPGKTAGWYLSRAGGANATANRKEIFVIQANGSVVGRRSEGWMNGDVLSTRLNPGDVVVVPQKIIGGSVIWRNLLSAGQIASSVAITAGVTAAAL